MKKEIILFSILVLLLPLAVVAQDFCVGDFDYDGDCDGTDAARFKQDFGRSIFENPCPPDGPAPVEKTGQTGSSVVTGDDGDLERGVLWPNPRFTDNNDGTVTDNLTGLIWLKDANCFGQQIWYHALSDCNGLVSGQCGLTDGSRGGDWRAPNVKELQSLIDFSQYEPALPMGHPFSNVQYGYWSSTCFPFVYYDLAWYMNLNAGTISSINMTDTAYAWCVRGGH
jgi:hypothetical protein